VFAFDGSIADDLRFLLPFHYFALYIAFSLIASNCFILS
jgi:hypothetical protein